MRTPLAAAALAAAVALCSCAAGHAQSAPDCIIGIVVSGPAGGTPDHIAQLGASRLQTALNRGTQVENRPGGRASAEPSA